MRATFSFKIFKKNEKECFISNLQLSASVCDAEICTRGLQPALSSPKGSKNVRASINYDIYRHLSYEALVVMYIFIITFALSLCVVSCRLLSPIQHAICMMF